MTVLVFLKQQSSLVHYAQEQAYCEAEFMSLRKQRRELEEATQEVKMRLQTKPVFL